MTDTEIRVARRIVAYMQDIAQQQVDLAFFEGLGLALAVLYEESTGHPVSQMKPQHLMEWALALPQVRYPRIMES